MGLVRSVLGFLLCDIKSIQETVVDVTVRLNGTLDTGRTFNCPVVITL